MKYRLVRNADGIRTNYIGEVTPQGIVFQCCEPDQCIHNIHGPFSMEQIEEMFESIEPIV